MVPSRERITRSDHLFPPSSPLPSPSPQISSDRIRLGCTVSRVNWAEGNAEGAEPSTAYPCSVEYWTSSTVDEGGPVPCLKRISCRQVVVTLGLGVLKVKTRLRPALP